MLCERPKPKIVSSNIVTQLPLVGSIDMRQNDEIFEIHQGKAT